MQSLNIASALTNTKSEAEGTSTHVTNISPSAPYTRVQAWKRARSLARHSSRVVTSPSSFLPAKRNLFPFSFFASLSHRKAGTSERDEIAFAALFKSTVASPHFCDFCRDCTCEFFYANYSNWPDFLGAESRQVSEAKGCFF